MTRRTDDEAVLLKTVQALQRGEQAVLCTLVKKVGSAPRDIGSKMVVFKEGTTCGTLGGGRFERLVVRRARKTLKTGRPASFDFSFGGEELPGSIETGLICGGTGTVFMDVLDPRPKLVIIGGGHIGSPLAELANALGFKVCVVDDSKDIVNRESFPMADELIVDKRFDKALKKADLAASDFVAIVHGDVDHDFEALVAASKSDARYIGLIGSRKKISEFKKRLREKGVKPERLRGRLFAPIGLDIGAETPAEIALSIVAEIVQNLRRWKPPGRS